MSHGRSLITLALVLGMMPSVRAQERDSKHEEAIQKTFKFLEEVTIDIKELPKETTLAKLLEAVAKQWPKDTKGTLRLDRADLG